MGVRIAEHMPDAYVVASRVSAKGQRTFKRCMWIALSLLVTAAIGGLVQASWGGWISAVAFVAGIVLTALAIARNAERDWYDGRALAESAKSLTFKFAVGGVPYRVVDADADAEYRGAVGALVDDLKKLNSTLAPSARVPDLEALIRLRSASLQERMAAYREQRLEDQADWYSTRGDDHRRTARRWRNVGLLFQAIGVAGAVAKGLGAIDLDLLGLCATVAAVATAWLVAGDHVAIARAYELAVLDLRRAILEADAVDSEDRWARFVADAEEAMSREHTMWAARRRGP